MSPSDTTVFDCCRLDIMGESSKLLAKGACVARFEAAGTAAAATESAATTALDCATAGDAAGMCADEKPVSTIGRTCDY